MASGMAKQEEEYQDLNLLSFSNEIVTDGIPFSVSKMECSHLKIQRTDNERHRIVVINKSSEVCSVCFVNYKC